MNSVLIYIGSVLITVWGIAHIFPTRNIVKGFGEISLDNRRIVAMTWIAEGVAMIAFGFLVFLITILGVSETQLALLVYRYSALVLFVLALNSLFTGFRTAVIPMKICPFVKLLSGILIVLGSGIG